MIPQMEIDIDILKTLCNNRAIRWTTHIMERLQERGIDPSDVKNCIATGQIIEQYPNDCPYPSCLILGSAKDGRALHSVMGVGNGQLWLITAYYPDPEKWNSDFSDRKEP